MYLPYLNQIIFEYSGMVAWWPVTRWMDIVMEWGASELQSADLVLKGLFLWTWTLQSLNEGCLLGKKKLLKDKNGLFVFPP